MKLKSELFYVYMICDLSLRLFVHSSSLPQKNNTKVLSIIHGMYEKVIQSNLSTTATLGTEESGLCREVTVTGR